MTSEIKASCAEFAANPVARGVKWSQLIPSDNHVLKFINQAFTTKIGDLNLRLSKSLSITRLYFLNVSYFDKDIQITIYASSYREAAEKAISLCRERVEKMYNEFKQLEG